MHYKYGADCNLESIARELTRNSIQEIKLATKFHDYSDSYLHKKCSVTQIPAGETVVAEILPLSLHLPSLV